MIYKPPVPGAQLGIYNVVAEDAPGAQAMTMYGTNEVVWIAGPSVITAADVANFSLELDEMGMPALGGQLNAAGSQKLAAATKAAIGGRLAIVVNGVLLSAPTVQSEVRNMFIITGNMSEQERDDLFHGLTGP